MKVLLIDDHSMFREALALLILARFPAMDLLHAGSQAQALALLVAHDDIALVLLDLHLPDADGAGTLALLREAAPEARWIVVSADERPHTVERVIDLGASGFVPKTADAGTLGRALEVILGGGVFIPSAALAAWPPRPPGDGVALGAGQGPGVSPDEADPLPGQSLSPRQREVLRLLVAGKSNKGICRELGLSESTIKTHVAEVFRRMGVSTRTQAVIAVAQRGGL